MMNLGSIPSGATITFYFTTQAATGAAVAPSSAFEAADVKLYKNGSATQRSSEAGWTMTSPFDSITGLHALTIDLSDNTDAGFYSVGDRYTAVLSPDETVDSLAVVSVIGTFRIVAAEATAGYPVSTLKVGTGTGEVNLSSGKVPATLAVGDDWRVIRTATAQAGTSGTITLDTGASSTDHFYRDAMVAILSGTGAGQVRFISSYAGGTRVATTETSWITTPDNTSVFAVLHWTGVPRAALVGTVTTVSAVTGLTASNLDAAISSRASQASVDTIDDFLDTEVAAILAAVDTEVAAIKAKTDNLPSDPADESSLQAAIAALNNLSSAQVTTAVNTALDTAISELGVAAPTATPTIRTALMLLYMALRNKVTVTSTAKKVHNDAGTSIAQKTLSDDGTTYTEAEMS